LIESQFAENVVKEIWRSSYGANDNIFSASSNHYLTFNYYNCIMDEEIKLLFYEKRDVSQFSAHPLQFKVWRASAKSRMLIEFVCTVALATVIHYFFSLALDDAKVVTEKFNRQLELEAAVTGDPASLEYQMAAAELNAYKVWIRGDVLTFFNRAMLASYLSFLPLFYAL